MFTPILAGLKRGIGEAFTNVFYVFVQAIWIALIAMVFFHVWYNVVDDPRTTLAYIAIAEAFWITGGTRVSRTMEREYQEGRIDFRLLRPIPMWLQYFSELLGPGLVTYITLVLILSLLLYAYAGVWINPLLAVLAYPLYLFAGTLLYFILGTFVVDLGRVNVLRWILSKFDLIFIVVPRALLGDLPYVLVPSAYIYYWPAMLALKGSIPPFWFVGVALMFVIAIVAEKRMVRKIEVFGG